MNERSLSRLSEIQSLSENSVNEGFLHGVSLAMFQVGQAWDTTHLPSLLGKDQGNKPLVYSVHRETEAKGSYRDSQLWGKSQEGSKAEPV